MTAAHEASSMQPLWEQRYGAEPFVYGTDPNLFLCENVSALPIGEILCLAEGLATQSVDLEPSIAWTALESVSLLATMVANQEDRSYSEPRQRQRTDRSNDGSAQLM